MTRPIHTIADEIIRDWKKPYFGAVPYLNALADLNSPSDKYYADDGHTAIVYFLSNASTWRGPVAKQIKAELRAMIKE